MSELTRSLLDQTKTALRLKTDNEDVIDEINALILTALADLSETAGVDTGLIGPESVIDTTDTREVMIAQAVKTYVRCHFGEPDDYDRLKKSYDEQKGMLKVAFRRLDNGSYC